MATTLNDIVSEFTPERRTKIETEADRLHEEYKTLQELRKAKALTQVQLAKTLGIDHATVAQMEKRSDLMISTLRSYIEAMGGKLNLTVEFPGRVPTQIAGLGDLADESPETPENH